MTSKNFFSEAGEERRLAARLTKEKMRHSLWALSLFALLLFFTMTLPTAMEAQQLMERRQIHGWTTEQIAEAGVETMSTVLGLSNGFTAIVIANMALVLAAVCFRYLHNKSQVDFYHSLPIRRPWLFAANFGSGLAGFAVAYFGNLLLSGLIVICAGYGQALLTPAVGAAVVLHCVFFLVVYAVCVLGCQLAGTTATGVLCGGVLLAGPLAAFGLFVVYAQQLFQNFYLPESVLLRVGDCCSPLWAYLSRCFHQTEDYAGRLAWGGTAFCWLLAGLAVAALACWAYCRRPSESAGKAASFQLPAAVLKYFAVALCALAGGLMFRVVVGGEGWMVFGFLLGGLLSHCLVEIIYHLDFKALFCHIRAFCLFAALFAAIYLCLAWDVFHYDSYLPQADQVQAVSVNLDWLDYYGSSYYHRNSGQGEDAILERLNRQTYRQPETIEAALELCRISQDDSIPDASYNRDEYYSTEVRYTLKSGRQVYRQYRVPRQAVEEQLTVLYDSQEYKQNYIPLYQKEPSEFQSVEIDLGMTNRPEQYLRQEGQAEKIAQALQQDVLEMRIQDIKNKGPIAIVTLSTDRNYGKQEYDDDLSFEISLPVYDTYENTLKALKEQGVETEATLRSYEVEKAYLWVGDESDAFVETHGLEAYFSSDANTKRILSDEWMLLTDWDTIQRLLQNAVPENLARRNPFFLIDRNHTQLRVVLDENQGLEIHYVFPEEEEE